MENKNKFLLYAKYPTIECFIIQQDTTVEELKNFIEERGKKVISIKRSSKCFALKFVPNKWTRMNVGSLVFFSNKECNFVLSKDVPTFLEFYQDTRVPIVPSKNLSEKINGKAPLIIPKQYQCPQCGFISNVPFTKCLACGADGNYCAEQVITFTDIASKIRRKKMSMENVNLDKVIEEANATEASAEVTAVYGDNVSVSKEEVDDQKDKEASNL